MNQLSWLIYFAGVSQSLSTFFILFGVIFFFGPLLLALIMHLHTTPSGDITIDSETPVLWRGKILAFGLFLMMAGNLMPPRDTVYAIAASEVGERVLHSETGNKAVMALNAWLDKQISDATGPKPEKRD